MLTITRGYAVLASLMAIAVLAFSGLSLTSPIVALAREVRLVSTTQPVKPVRRAAAPRRPLLRVYDTLR
jgi:Flp pilus assembly protein protease CpaA